MSQGKIVSFVFKSVVIGLAAAFLIIYFKPDLLQPKREIVEIQQGEPAVAAPATNLSGPISYAPAVEQASPAVVNIYTTKIIEQRTNPLFNDPFFRYFFGDQGTVRRREQNSLGSGVLVSKQGYVLTNNHVIEGADEILVALQDGRGAEARVVGSDPETDLAVLKIELEDLPVIQFGDSDKIRVGDVVLAIGNPFGVGQTVTSGIVSATGRNQLGINTFENFIQTDAAINPGNSGGALINAFGHLIGINTAIYSRSGGSQGIGFAIPVTLAKEIMAEIIENGHVARGYLGIETQDITPALAESFGLKNTQGVIIAAVLRVGPAAKAGLRPGDVITHIDGQPVNNSRKAIDMIAQNKPGATIEINAIRAGKAFQAKVKVGERPPTRPR